MTAVTGRTGPATTVARLRRTLWRAVLTLTGGIRVYGEPPGRPGVLVANHSSHADTVALLAALPAAMEPRVAASAEYWFTRRLRSWICRVLTGAFPMHRYRSGGPDRLAAAVPNGLATARELIVAGHLVIVYPEGTRSRDGSLGSFRPGAGRLAERAGVPMIPVGITGTRQLLPVHGRLHRQRITVRFGTPVPDLAAARQSIAELCAAPCSPSSSPAAPASPRTAMPITRDSRLRQRVAAFAGSPAGLLTVFAWAVAEAVFWPLIPEFALAILCVANPRRSLWLGLSVAAGSLVGGALMYVLAANGVHPPQLLTTDRMHAHVADQVAVDGAQGLRRQAFSGIPFKVYGQTAGSAHVGLLPFLVNCLPGRLLRMIVIGAALGGFGALLRRWRRLYPAYIGVFLIVFALGLAKVISNWR